eukprot:TRINITY_DN88822_c0_g1_i1.p2 TRINITY_DN88822_c0_g1~~TRINITY_DN88822_c0_g1_i1.p2  ORF type:complete len:151 (+),score=21.41 TRINITY_DN88822_c0_g1_i1:41-454(+)
MTVKCMELMASKACNGLNFKGDSLAIHCTYATSGGESSCDFSKVYSYKNLDILADYPNAYTELKKAANCGPQKCTCQASKAAPPSNLCTPAVNCGSPPSLSNAQQTSNTGTGVNSTTEYTCDTGHEVSTGGAQQTVL